MRAATCATQRSRPRGPPRSRRFTCSASPRPAHAYVEKAFGEHLPAVRRAMERLADSLPPDELNRTGFRLYEQFRPEVPAGAKGWGAKGVLDVKRIEDALG